MLDRILRFIAEKLSDTGWIKLNDYISYRKKADVIYVRISNMPKPSAQILGTLPTGFRPLTTEQMYVRGNLKNTVVSAWIGANGQINVNHTALDPGISNISGFTIYPV